MSRRFVVAAGVMVALAAARASTQSPAAAPRFEVASVKRGMSPFDAGRAAGATLVLARSGLTSQLPTLLERVAEAERARTSS